MALTVGELTGLITLDPSGVDEGLHTAETRMHTAGTQMATTADRAGRQAGQNLGDGITQGTQGALRGLDGQFVTAGQQAGDGLVRGADGRLRDLRGRFVAAGRRAGDGLGDALENSSTQGAGDAVQGMDSKLAALPMLAAGVGLAAGAALMAAFTTSLDQGRIVGRLGAQLGATGPEAQRYGKIAGSMFANAVTEDFQTAADAISATMRAGIAPPGATNAQIESISTKVADLASTFELDLGQAANAVGQMIKTGLAKDGTEAVDALTRGLQKMGPRADDIADTFNEYSTIFRQMGISATDATGLLSQGMKAGARDTDVVADSLKEFVLITQDGGDEVDAAFAKIGLSGKDMQAAFVEGGPKAKKALDDVFDGLRNMEEGADRNSVALTLFGTKSEDTQKALMALDPSKATESLGKVGGAADKMGNSLRDNAGTKVEAFKRGLQQGVVNFLGGTVLPAVERTRNFIVSRFGSMWAEAGKGGTTGVDQVLAFVGILGERVVMKIRELAPRAIQGLIGLGQDLANWMIANPTTVFKVAALATAIMVGFAMLPFLVGAALLAAANTIVASFVTRMVTGAQTKLGQLGTTVGAWFGRLWSTYLATPVSNVWNLFIASVRGLPGRAVAALNILGSRLSGVANRAWTDFKNAAARKQAEFITWVNGIPGRITRAVGSLDDLLYDKGQDLIRGLVNGVKSMGGWLAGQLTSFARSKIPGPIAKALGISSPSKVMACEVGRWIPAGIAKGVQANAGVVDRTMSSLVNTPTPSAAMAGAVGGAMSGAGGGRSGSSSTVRVDLGGTQFGEFLVGQIRDAVGNRGGDVQLVLSGRR